MCKCVKCGFDPDAKMGQSWTATAESYAPSVNETGANTKINRVYRQWRKRWEKQFGPWLKTLPPAKAKRRVQITRVYSGRQRPYDRINFASGCKPLLDTLVEFGGLYDDSPTWCDDYYEQRKSPDGKDYIVVTIDEFADE